MVLILFFRRGFCAGAKLSSRTHCLGEAVISSSSFMSSLSLLAMEIAGMGPGQASQQ